MPERKRQNGLAKVAGFTLIELLVVIAILAILAVAVVLVINPAELLRQSRDTTRLSDLAAVNSALALYVADLGSSAGIGGADNAACSTNALRCTVATTTNPFDSTAANGCGSGTAVTSTTVDGTGWVLVDFANISSGAPLGRLPLDPSQTSAYLYGYGCSGLNWELITSMESVKYRNGGTSDVESNTKDGGDKDTIYEIGSDLLNI